MAWTDDKIEQLKKYWEKGISASQIAEKLGDVTRNAVIGKAHRLDLKPRPSPVAKTSTKTKQPAKKVAATPEQPKEQITILTLTDRICKWPTGHPGEPNFHFCGRRSLPGQPYCPDHAAQAYQVPAPKRERKNFVRNAPR